MHEVKGRMLIPAIVLQSLLFPRDVKFHPHDHRGLLALDILHDRNYLRHALIDFSNQRIFLWQFARVRDKTTCTSPVALPTLTIKVLRMPLFFFHHRLGVDTCSVTAQGH